MTLGSNDSKQTYIVHDGVQRTSARVGRTLHHQVVTVAAPRTRAAKSPDLWAMTLQAPTTNAAAVFIGGSSVTTTAGNTPGLALAPGVDYGPIELSKAEELYVAGTAGDKLVIFGVG